METYLELVEARARAMAEAAGLSPDAVRAYAESRVVEARRACWDVARTWDLETVLEGTCAGGR